MGGGWVARLYSADGGEATSLEPGRSASSQMREDKRGTPQSHPVTGTPSHMCRALPLVAPSARGDCREPRPIGQIRGASGPAFRADGDGLSWLHWERCCGRWAGGMHMHVGLGQKGRQGRRRQMAVPPAIGRVCAGCACGRPRLWPSHARRPLGGCGGRCAGESGRASEDREMLRSVSGTAQMIARGLCYRAK